MSIYGPPRRPLSRAASPIPPAMPVSSYTPYISASPLLSGDPMVNAMSNLSMGPGPQASHAHAPLRRPASQADFKVEKVARPPSSMGQRYSPQNSAPTEIHFDENVYRQRVTTLIAAKDRPAFATTGYVFVDPAQVVLFFRSKSGIAQSLDFPIDVGYASPPALDVLIAACRPHQTSNYNGYLDRESLFYPPTLPLTTSLEISNFPILDAVKNSLFPNLPTGHYLTTVKDTLEVLLDGGRLERQTAHQRNDGRAATILLTLPVRFQGGALIIRDPLTGLQERFMTKAQPNPPPVAPNGTPMESMEWVAFLGNCDYETEMVDKGYRVMMSYGVYVKSFSPEGAARFDSLTIPTDGFFDLLAPVMNMSRGKKIAFYLAQDYAVNPSLVTAPSLVPQLRGGDYLLYHAFKMYRLSPELHWSAGEYIWPTDRVVELFSEDISSNTPSVPSIYGNASTRGGPVPYGPINPPSHPRGHTPLGTYSGYPNSPPQGFQPDHDPLRSTVEESGGQLLSEAGVTVLKDFTGVAVSTGAVERVPFIASGELQKFVVNVLMVVYVP